MLLKRKAGSFPPLLMFVHRFVPQPFCIHALPAKLQYVSFSKAQVLHSLKLKKLLKNGGWETLKHGGW